MRDKRAQSGFIENVRVPELTGRLRWMQRQPAIPEGDPNNPYHLRQLVRQADSLLVQDRAVRERWSSLTGSLPAELMNHQNTWGDKTAIELVLAGVQSWNAGMRRILLAFGWRGSMIYNHLR